MNYHFFGSTCMSWATGNSREEVLLKLWNATGAETIGRAMKTSDDPFYAWTCMVEGESGVYRIDQFRPHGVKCADFREYDLLPKKQWREIIRNPAQRFHAAQLQVNCPPNSTMVVPLLATSHLTYETFDILQGQSQRIVQDGECNGIADTTVAALSGGGFMLCFNGCVPEGMPDDLRAVYDWWSRLPAGAFHGWVRFDDMADSVPGLPEYDHDGSEE